MEDWPEREFQGASFPIIVLNLGLADGSARCVDKSIILAGHITATKPRIGAAEGLILILHERDCRRTVGWRKEARQRSQKTIEQESMISIGATCEVSQP